MDTNRLHQFKILVETASLRKAAELLNISHAGLSKSIRVLESELGIILTSRDGRNIRITKEGLRVYKELASVLEAEHIFFSSIHGEKNQSSKKTARIGTFEVFSTYLAPEIIKSIKEKVDIEFQELIPGKIERALLDNHIDLGISYMAIPHSELDHLEICKVSMAVYSLKNTFNDLEFKQLPFVAPLEPIEGSPTRARGLDGWPDDRFRRFIKYKVDLLETAVSLVRRGLAVAYLPKFIADLHNKLVKPEFCLVEIPLPIKIKAQQPVFLIKRKSDEETLLAKQIAIRLRALI